MTTQAWTALLHPAAFGQVDKADLLSRWIPTTPDMRVALACSLMTLQYHNLGSSLHGHPKGGRLGIGRVDMAVLFLWFVPGVGRYEPPIVGHLPMGGG